MLIKDLYTSFCSSPTLVLNLLGLTTHQYTSYGGLKKALCKIVAGISRLVVGSQLVCPSNQSSKASLR